MVMWLDFLVVLSETETLRILTTDGIDIEGNLDLRNTQGREEFHAFTDLDDNTKLVVRVCREIFGLRWYRSVVLGESGLNTQRDGCNVQEEKILHFLQSVAGSNGSLDGSSIGNGFIRVNVL